jgi:hypothetical protein
LLKPSERVEKVLECKIGSSRRMRSHAYLISIFSTKKKKGSQDSRVCVHIQVDWDMFLSYSFYRSLWHVNIDIEDLN